MPRDELERLSKAELIELVLRLQRPEKTSRTSSKPPSTDRKERREQARPGGAKPGHEGHSRMLSTDADRVVDHAPQQCPCCRIALSPDLPSEAVSVHERIELPEIKPLPLRLKLWLHSAFALADDITHLAASTVAAKRRALERSLAAILAAPTSCDLARDIQNRFRRARDQLLTFADWPGKAEATNNGCERDLRPCVIQRKVTNGYRAMWAAEGEADIRSVVATARLKPGTSVFSTILQTVTA